MLHILDIAYYKQKIWKKNKPAGFCHFGGLYSNRNDIFLSKIDLKSISGNYFQVAHRLSMKS